MCIGNGANDSAFNWRIAEGLGTGVFSQLVVSGSRWNDAWTGEYNFNYINIPSFKASSGNSTYGNSESVNPTSLSAYFFIKF